MNRTLDNKDTGEPLPQSVMERIKAIILHSGKTCTYGEVANNLGEDRLSCTREQFDSLKAELFKAEKDWKVNGKAKGEKPPAAGEQPARRDRPARWAILCEVVRELGQEATLKRIAEQSKAKGGMSGMSEVCKARHEVFPDRNFKHGYKLQPKTPPPAAAKPKVDRKQLDPRNGTSQIGTIESQEYLPLVLDMIRTAERLQSRGVGVHLRLQTDLMKLSLGE